MDLSSLDPVVQGDFVGRSLHSMHLKLINLLSTRARTLGCGRVPIHQVETVVHERKGTDPVQ